MLKSGADEERLLEAARGAVHAIGAGRPFEEILESIANALMAFLGADRCVCAILEGPARSIAAAHGWTIEGERIKEPAAAVSHFLLRQVTRSAKPIYVADARADRRWRSQEDQRLRRQVRSLAGIPVSRGGEPFSVMCFSHSSAPLSPRVEDPLPFLVAQLPGLAPRGSARANGAKEEPPPVRLPAPADLTLAELFAWRGFITRSRALAEALETAKRIARSHAPVLIVGEDGTGKDQLARGIHAESGRSGEFVVVSASAIPDSLIEAELFGYVQGAFTGAEASRRGLVAEAHGGTIFIDDLPEVPEAMQGALLRVLAEGVVRPLGSDEALAVDFRLIAGTTLSPEELKRQRILREDLLYRLHGVTISLPPLRNRPEDIRLLFDRFLREEACGAVPHLTGDAERFLLLHPWPGNVRELRNEASRLCALVQGEIKSEDLSFVPAAAELRGSVTSTLSPLSDAVMEAERGEIERALALSGGNKSEAARLLGITRRSLYRRLKRYRFLS